MILHPDGIFLRRNRILLRRQLRPLSSPKQDPLHPFRKPQIIFFQKPQHFLRIASVRIGESGGDHILAPSHHIRQDHRIRLPAPQASGQLSSLDRRQPLADQIDLRDIRPAPQQPLRRLLNVRKGQSLLRKLQQGGAASGDQKQYGISLSRFPYETHRSLTCPDGILIRNRVSGFHDKKAGQRSFRMAVLCHHEPLFHPRSQHVRRGLCHHPGRLPHRKDKNAPLQLQSFQSVSHRPVRKNVFNGFPDDRFRMLIQNIALPHLLFSPFSLFSFPRKNAVKRPGPSPLPGPIRQSVLARQMAEQKQRAAFRYPFR